LALAQRSQAGSARAGVVVVAALFLCAGFACGRGTGAAAADPQPTPPQSTPQPYFYATPSPSPADDLPIIYHAPLPIPTAPAPGQVVQPLAPGQTPAPQSTTVPLAQGLAVIKADELYGNGGPVGDITALGHVDIVYGSVEITADQAVYDGTTKIITATGHVKFVSADGDSATAKTLQYGTVDGRVEMTDVEGQSSQVYSSGQQIQGYLYYKAAQVTTYPDGHTILKNGWITTCDLSHVAYHITGKEIEIRPGDRVIAHSSDLYLGKYLVAALGIIVIPLSRAAAEQHPSALAPAIGYNSTLGFFVKTYISFYKSPYFYGTYHIDLYQRVGIGLGADLYFYRKDGRGQGTLTVYDLHSDQAQAVQTGQKNSFQGNLSLQEPLGQHLTGSLQYAFTGQSSIFSPIPSQTSASLTINHDGERTQTNYGLNLSDSGGNSSVGLTLSHTIQFSENLSQNFSLSTSNTSVAGSSFSHQVGFDSDTHFNGRALDGDLAVDTSNGYEYTDGIGGTPGIRTPLLAFEKVPELTLDAHPFEIDQVVPLDFTLIAGVYNDPYETLGTTSQHIETSRLEAGLQLGDALIRVGGNSDLTAMATLRQDAYGTGDLRGLLGEDYSLHTLYGDHADSTLTYDVNSVRGFTPLSSFDGESTTNTYTESFDVYNGSYYRFTTSTDYDLIGHQQGPITYQLTTMPRPYSTLTLGTSFQTAGGGYGPVDIQLQTPVGKYDYFQMLASYDFKLHGLQAQNYYLTHNVNDCYLVKVAYLQPLHEVDLSVSLLAFPGEGANFGFTGQGSLLPTSFGSVSQ
jgi:hypothetical protein